MIHHKWSTNGRYQILFNISKDVESPYGVSSYPRILNAKLMMRHYDRIRDCLQNVLHLTTAQREVVLRMLRLYAYYGQVFPEQSQVSETPGCSKVTFWRTISRLEQMGLIMRVRRYWIREKAQTSNLYKMEKLLIILARYIREKYLWLADGCIKGILSLGGAEFWSWAWDGFYYDIQPAMGAP